MRDSITSTQHVHICEYFYLIESPITHYSTYGEIMYEIEKYINGKFTIEDIDSFNFISEFSMKLILYPDDFILKQGKEIGLDIISSNKDEMILEIINHLQLTQRLLIYETRYIIYE